MALNRRDCRCKLDPDMHAKLKAFCDVEDIDMGEWIERLIVPVIEQQVHGAIALAERLQRLGLSRSTDRPAGKPGSGRE